MWITVTQDMHFLHCSHNSTESIYFWQQNSENQRKYKTHPFSSLEITLNEILPVYAVAKRDPYLAFISTKF